VVPLEQVLGATASVKTTVAVPVLPAPFSGQVKDAFDRPSHVIRSPLSLIPRDVTDVTPGRRKPHVCPLPLTRARLDGVAALMFRGRQL
jgi:hypothetical protein